MHETKIVLSVSYILEWATRVYRVRANVPAYSLYMWQASVSPAQA